MNIETISAEQYATERAICDAAQDYADSVMSEGTGKRVRNYLTKEEAAAPVYAACDNDMRGRVEQYELLRDLPAVIYCYLSQSREERESTNVVRARPLRATVWTGLPLGTARRVSPEWRAGGWNGSKIAQYEATIGGRTYTGRGQGAGMCITLKETAASRRARESV